MTSDSADASADTGAPQFDEGAPTETTEGDAPGTTAAPSGVAAPPAAAFTAEDLARANYQTFGPLLQQIVPQPEAPKTPWSDPVASWGALQGVQDDRVHSEYQTRHEQLARHIAQEEVRTALEKQRVEFQNILRGQADYFQAQFARDPGFQRIEPFFRKYSQEGLPPAYARRLAEEDAGISRPAGPSGQAAPRPAPVPPRYATSPATRTAPGGGPSPKLNAFNKAEVESHFFNTLAPKHGWPDY